MTEALLADFRAGRAAALARAVSIVENRSRGASELLAALHPDTNRAYRVGITGPPGAGKSTVTSQLTRYWREQGRSVGVVAVDPTSPFTGGAILGDRIRMEAVSMDDRVFIRSMATRGSLGGLASTTRDVCDVIDAFGFDRLLIETVGVGQSELEITNAADTTVVLFVPESGDSIQTLKAGITEIGDILAVNKCDRPGGDSLARELRTAVDMRGSKPDEWTPPVLTLAARDGHGISDLAGAIERHGKWLEESGTLRTRRRARLRVRVRDAVNELLQERLWTSGVANETIDDHIDALEGGRTSPLSVAELILRDVAANGHSTL